MVLCVRGFFFPPLSIDTGQVQVLLSHCGQAWECVLPPGMEKTSEGKLPCKVNAELESPGQIQPLALKRSCNLVPCMFFDGQQMKTILHKNVSRSVSSIIIHLPFQVISLGLYWRVCFIFTCKSSSLKRLVFYVNNLLSLSLNNVCVLSR